MAYQAPQGAPGDGKRARKHVCTRASGDRPDRAVVRVPGKSALDQPLPAGPPTAVRIEGIAHLAPRRAERPRPDRAPARTVGTPGPPGSGKTCRVGGLRRVTAGPEASTGQALWPSLATVPPRSRSSRRPPVRSRPWFPPTPDELRSDEGHGSAHGASRPGSSPGGSGRHHDSGVTGGSSNGPRTGRPAAPAGRLRTPTSSSTGPPRRRASACWTSGDQRSPKRSAQVATSVVVTLPPQTTRPSLAPSPTRSSTWRAAGSRQPAAGSAQSFE